MENEKKTISDKRRKNLAIYQRRYRTEKNKTFGILINRETDKDIIAKLESVPNKSEYLKELIRKDIEGSK